jgi:hypothetical protein
VSDTAHFRPGRKCLVLWYLRDVSAVLQAIFAIFGARRKGALVLEIRGEAAQNTPEQNIFVFLS